ncbi:MAG TPA: hypothetical protein ENG54_00175 [Thermofilum sp.]|nr:hypothetical protein [Thermofilum sp.]
MEAFQQYLEKVSSKTKVKIEKGRIRWIERYEAVDNIPVDFFDNIYLNKRGDIVVLSKSTAQDIKERISFLEENLYKYRRLTKVLVAACIAELIIILALIGGLL